MAQRLAAFGAHVVAYDPYVSPARAAQLGIELLTLDELLGRADFISVHLPKTPETAGLIGKEQLAKTKPGVIIVNAARGGLVDEEALAEAISSAGTSAAPASTCSPPSRAPTARCSSCRRSSSPRTWARRPPRRRTGRAPTWPRACSSRWPASSCPTRSTCGGGVVGEEVAPWLDLVRKLGRAGRRAVRPSCRSSLSVQVRGELAAEDVEVLRLSALRGLFSAVDRGPGHVRQRAGAGRRARRRGRASPRRPRARTTAASSTCARSCSDGSVVNVAGTLSGPQQVEKIVQINGRNFDLRAEGIIPDRQLRRPAGRARQDRHAAR